jgi:FkbM family methyltransferase
MNALVAQLAKRVPFIRRLAEERDAALTQRAAAILERDTALAARDAALVELDKVLAAHAAATSAKSASRGVSADDVIVCIEMILGRTPDAELVDYHLRRGFPDRFALGKYMINTGEFQSRFAGAMRNVRPASVYEELVEFAYRATLLRSSDDIGQTHWVNLLKSNKATLQDLLSFLFSSQEFSLHLRPFLDTYLGAKLPLMNEHSQNRELSILITHMVNSLAKHRIVVDAGAHGRMGSNSYDLMRHFGWRGILIEPNPALVTKIKDEFDGLNFVILPVAVSNFRGTAPLYLGIDGQISSIQRESTAQWGEITGVIEVPVEKLSDILIREGIPLDFDLLSSDTEGEECNILHDLVDHGFRPHWIIMETYLASEVKDLNTLPLPTAIVAEYQIIGRTFPNLILSRQEC